jgi:hypothetical protein
MPRRVSLRATVVVVLAALDLGLAVSLLSKPGGPARDPAAGRFVAAATATPAATPAAAPRRARARTVASRRKLRKQPVRAAHRRKRAHVRSRPARPVVIPSRTLRPAPVVPVVPVHPKPVPTATPHYVPPAAPPSAPRPVPVTPKPRPAPTAPPPSGAFDTSG